MPARNPSKWSVLARMAPHLREHRGRITAGFICILLTNGFMLTAPWVTKYAVDSLTESVTRQKLAYYGILIVGLALLRSTFQFFMRRLIIGVSRDIEYAFRNELFAHLERLPMSFYQKNRTGELMSRATNDLSNVRNLVGPAIMYTANTIVTALFAVALMLKINWQLTLLALAPLPIVSISTRYFGKKIHDLTEESQAMLSALKELEAKRLNDYARLRKELETVAVVVHCVKTRNLLNGAGVASHGFHPVPFSAFHGRVTDNEGRIRSCQGGASRRRLDGPPDRPL